MRNKKSATTKNSTPRIHIHHTIIPYAAYTKTQLHSPKRTSTDAHEICENFSARNMIYESRNQIGQLVIWISGSSEPEVRLLIYPTIHENPAQKNPNAMVSGIIGKTSIFTTKEINENL